MSAFELFFSLFQSTGMKGWKVVLSNFSVSSVLSSPSTGTPCRYPGPRSRRSSAGRRTEVGAASWGPPPAPAPAGWGRGSGTGSWWHWPASCCDFWRCWAGPAAGWWAAAGRSADRTPVWNVGRRRAGLWRCSPSSPTAPGRRCWSQECRSAAPYRSARSLPETFSARQKQIKDD